MSEDKKESIKCEFIEFSGDSAMFWMKSPNGAGIRTAFSRDELGGIEPWAGQLFSYDRTADRLIPLPEEQQIIKKNGETPISLAEFEEIQRNFEEKLRNAQPRTRDGQGGDGRGAR